jgi:hypothetical protein
MRTTVAKEKAKEKARAEGARLVGSGSGSSIALIFAPESS